MSKLRFPFRSSPSSNNVTASPATPKDGTSPFWDGGGNNNIGNGDDYLSKNANGSAKAKNKTAAEIERLWGLENFGNTCYCNSVLQALYACQPFRQFVESYPSVPPPLSALGPPPGTASQPNTNGTGGAFGGTGSTTPSSPLAEKRGNPFDSPGANGGSPMSPSGNEEKRSWKKLGRRPTSSSTSAPPSLATIQQGQMAKQSSNTGSAAATGGGAGAAGKDVPSDKGTKELPLPDPNQPPPSVFQTMQTLFEHLTHSAPHQPLPPRKDAKKEGESAQTASLLPADGVPGSPTGPQPSLTATSTPSGALVRKPEEPQGPPLLASLPPPSAPRGGGPFSAGSLGRGVVRPEDVLKTIKRENEMFRGMAQQDAHEFLGWVLNKVSEEIEMVNQDLRNKGQSVEGRPNGKTFVQNLFEGCLTNETRCLSCESTSSRDELFLDLSIDIEQHTSVTSCLRGFSASEMLCQKNKFYCDSCCGLQEAEKRMKIKRLPNILALHLKRFKYQETLGRYTKLFYRVPFPTQLRLPNTSDDTENPDRLYELFAVVVHIGNGPHHGHYVAMVRSAGRWVMCDDENVEPIEESDIFRYFGDYPSGAGYVLFYQAADLNLAELGLKVPEPQVPASPVVETHAQVPQPQADTLIDLGTHTSAVPPATNGSIQHPPIIENPFDDQPESLAPPISPSAIAGREPLKLSIPNNDYGQQSDAVRAPPTASATAPSAAVPIQNSQPSIDRQIGFSPSPATIVPPSAKEKKDSSKWFNRVGSKDSKEKDDRRLSGMSTPVRQDSVSNSAASTGPAGRITPQRQSTQNTISSATTRNANGTPEAASIATVPSAMLASEASSIANNGHMSSSMISNVSAASASTQTTSTSGGGGGLHPASSSSYGAAAPAALGRQASVRDRTVSASSAISNTSFAAGSSAGNNNASTSASSSSGYAGGSSLGRKLSGMSGKSLLGRSGSIMKLGLGKKDKDKEGKEAKDARRVSSMGYSGPTAGGIQEVRREEERQGLLK